MAVRPDHVALRDAASLAVLARVRLGDFAEQRWGAPYLVAHRADLHSALIARASRAPDISIITDAAVRDFALYADGVTVSIDRDGKIVEASGRMLVAADGVWSSLRALAGDKGKSRFSGRIAWRAAVRGDGAAGKIIAGITEPNSVTAFLHPNSHMIVYPLRGGDTLNLVAVTEGSALGENWSGQADPALLDARGRRRFQRHRQADQSGGELDRLADPHRRLRRSMDARRRLCADRRRRPCNDALCRARRGDGHRGCGHAGRCRGNVAG